MDHDRFGDMSPDELRRAGRIVIDRIADHLAHPERFPVLAPVSPGDVTNALPASPPANAEPFDQIIADYERIIVPATTQWNHPGFFGYFGISSSGVAILAEALTAALDTNAMLWRTAPAATELEHVTLDWLRQLLGLPASFEGTINDTASSSTLYALVAACEAQADLRIRELGMAGRADLPPLRIYCSTDAHSSVDKAALTLGLGLAGVRHIETDAEFRMDVGQLEAAIAEDRAAGIRPIAVVATVGTTATTAVDPVAPIAELCARERIWLHVDASYAGVAAIVPEMRGVLDGCARADSIVVNAHKWLFVPIDCSALYCRRPDVLRRAFSLTPDYLETPDVGEMKNLMDYGLALGRRMRALKLWFVLRYFGARGIADRLREHMRLASCFAAWVDAAPGFERLAPVPFSVVLFRHRPDGMSDAETDAWNANLLDRVNASGEVFLSHTRVRGRYGLRLAIGNIRTMETHVRRAWTLIREAVASEAPAVAG